MARGDKDKADNIENAFREALRHGALPGSSESFDDKAVEAAAAFLMKAAATRAPGTPSITIESLSAAPGKRDRSASSHPARIAIVNDDMPFLVDSIANCLSQQGMVIQQLVHPVLSVERDSRGKLVDILPDDSAGARRESVVYIEVDRATAKQRKSLEAEIAATLAHVRAAVNDWGRMQEALAADADRLNEDEGAALLRWLLARNLTQIGHRICYRGKACDEMLGICALPDNEPLLAAGSIKAAFDWFEEGGRSPLIIKSNQASRVHRSSLIDLFIIPIREGKKITALSIHAGMWTSAALATAPDKVPMLRAALTALMEKYHFDPAGHAGKALFHALTTLPHDIIIGFDRATLERLALTFMSLNDRPRPKLVLATSALQRHLYAFIWLPRDDVSTARRVAIQEMLAQAANAPLLSWSIALEEGGMALLRITLDIRAGGRTPDENVLDKQVKHMVRGWVPGVEAALAELLDNGGAETLTEEYAESFPPGYRLGAGPEEAAIDIIEMSKLEGEADRRVRLYRNSDDKPDQLRLKLYSQTNVTLSDAVPALENFGFKAIEEISTPLDRGRKGHMHRFLLARHDGGDAVPLLERANILQDTLAAVLTGLAEDDRFNELIVSAGMEPSAVILMRAIFRYLRQTGMHYGMATVVDTLRREQHIAHALTGLFGAMHDPAFKGDRNKAIKAGDEAIMTGLASVSAIDEDRILRLIQAVIHACLRTNFYVESGRLALAFKIESTKVPGLPKPLPWREIWVYSPRVEGIHLRSGPVARGGLRWSDRRDDFRTEILGLMKAQRVKNAVIVPAGAKGGFYPKQLPNPAMDRDAWLAEGTESYRIFIRSLLSITDNIVSGKVVHPKGLVVRDDDDPYFVVAADKGTATFSDVANAIALERDFWLGDAFASGGSNGYDHKAMGITARGAWVSVQRHFAEMGIDVQSQSVKVIGCGDMSGDVFGNGMLLSKAIKLVAAFDHRHIFIDPDPDPAKSWAERDRLFKLPRSSWDDYDKSLISEGGGVFPRSMKSIPLSPEMKALLDVGHDEMDPASLISAILQSPNDLLWFGGIGTYIKAAAQSNGDAGDTANDALRVNAEDLRVKVIGEGANLGVTQAGRIAYALNGGRINTDFIDNSAGVDCSDNEVNIKIALNREMAEGRLALDDRNALLVEMTDNVAHLVLEDNRLQALGLSIAEAGGSEALPSYVRLIETFEDSGTLDRRVEGLANNDQLLRRVQDSKGLTRPELAVLLSTAKLTLQDAIERGTLADDPSMGADLAASFPQQMQEREADAIASHQLRREIIATELANRIINRLGLIHPYEMVEEEGCSLADIASAFVVADRIFGVKALWQDIDTAEMPEKGRIELLGLIAKAMRSQMASIVRITPPGFVPGEAVAALRDGVEQLSGEVDAILTEILLARAALMEDDLELLGVPGDLAQRVSMLFKMDGALGLANLNQKLGGDMLETARAFVRLGDATGVHWLQTALAKLDPSDPWERQLLSGIERDTQQMRLDLLGRLGTKNALENVEAWLGKHKPRIDQFLHQFERAKAAPAPHVAMLAELTGQARGLMSR
ncbi:MAG: NAD-glutamate dehydrogenase [Sphingobium sp.]|nr:NAD-glutamate dehydrogenase [Sphingobium sp.]MCP5398103.1 NAD-glutamate dehydrogenase [Sphingomonas sp.]